MNDIFRIACETTSIHILQWCVDNKIDIPSDVARIAHKNNNVKLIEWCEKNNIRFMDYSEESWDKYSTCEGCRYGFSNQQGHMEVGGCLYLEE